MLCRPLRRSPPTAPVPLPLAGVQNGDTSVSNPPPSDISSTCVDVGKTLGALSAIQKNATDYLNSNAGNAEQVCSTSMRSSSMHVQYHNTRYQNASVVLVTSIISST